MLGGLSFVQESNLSINRLLIFEHFNDWNKWVKRAECSMKKQYIFASTYMYYK